MLQLSEGKRDLKTFRGDYIQIQDNRNADDVWSENVAPPDPKPKPQPLRHTELSV